MARRPEIARHYIENRAPAMHDVFTGPSHFKDSVSGYEAEEIHLCRDTLLVLQNKVPELIDFDVEDCSWEEVLHELDRAKTESEGRGQRLPNKAWRGLGTASNMIAAGLDAFPDELCILKGGLGVVFALARQRQTNRLKIVGAFENIPNIIATANGTAKGFPLDDTSDKSVRLHDCLWELYKTLLIYIPHLVRRLNPKSIFSKAMSPFQGPDIDTILGKITAKADAVKVHADFVRDHLIVESHSTLKENREHNEILRVKMEEMLDAQKSLQETLDGIHAKNGLYQILLEQTRHPSVGSIITDSIAPEGGYDLAPSLMPGDLLTLLDVHHLDAIKEKNHIISQGHSFDSEAIDQVGSLGKTRQIQDWLHKAQAGVVLLEGHGERSRLSPISYACALWAEALREGQQTITLIFFCGQHVAENDPLEGPQGLVRSLLSQLIMAMLQHQWIFGSVPITVSHVEGELGSLSLEDVCQLLHQLLRSVPETIPSKLSVYCIIDGISYFEADRWTIDYDLVIGTLNAIIEDDRLGCYFKLLLTSPTKCSRLSALPHQRVSLRGRREGLRLGSKRSFQAAFKPLDKSE